MSEQALRAFVDKLLADEGFRDRVSADANAVVDEFDLSPAERAALGSNDEDALRRLIGSELSGFGLVDGIPIAQYTPFGQPATAGLICIRTTQITWTDNENAPCLHSPC